MTSYNMTDVFPFITQLVLGTTSHVYRTSSMVALRGVTRTLNLEVWTVSREEQPKVVCYTVVYTGFLCHVTIT